MQEAQPPTERAGGPDVPSPKGVAASRDLSREARRIPQERRLESHLMAAPVRTPPRVPQAGETGCCRGPRDTGPPKPGGRGRGTRDPQRETPPATPPTNPGGPSRRPRGPPARQTRARTVLRRRHAAELRVAAPERTSRDGFNSCDAHRAPWGPPSSRPRDKPEDANAAAGGTGQRRPLRKQVPKPQPSPVTKWKPASQQQPRDMPQGKGRATSALPL